MIRLILISFLLRGFVLYSQDIDYARKIVNTLASGQFSGRGYTNHADLKSAEFIRNEFRISGLDPRGKEYFQYFNIDVNTFPGEIELRVNQNLLVPGEDYLVDPSSPSINGKFQVLRINRLDLTKPEVIKSIISEADGKAILIDLNDTLIFSKEEDEKISKLINSIKYNPIIKNSLTLIHSDKKLTWSISALQAKKSVVIINSNNLKTSVITEVEVNIEAKFKKNYRTQNIIGVIPGTVAPDSFLVITAHYDHLGIMGKSIIFPGANDNASGVAMILTLGKYFAANPPKYSLVLIAFSAEELGLLGAENFTNNPLFEIEKTKFLINFDLAGTGEDGIKVVNATIFNKEFESLQKINTSGNFLPSVQPRGEACISDHCMFYMKKLPCFYIYTLGGISAYHDIYDNPETLPLTEFQNYSRLMISFLNSF